MDAAGSTAKAEPVTREAFGAHARAVASWFADLQTALDNEKTVKDCLHADLTTIADRAAKLAAKPVKDQLAKVSGISQDVADFVANTSVYSSK